MLELRKGFYLLIIAFILLHISACTNNTTKVEKEDFNLQNKSEAAKPVEEESNQNPTESVSDNTKSDSESSATIRFYLSADQTISKASGRSIEQGIHVALSEIDYELHGQRVEVVVLDHKGNSQRAKKHLDDYIQDDNALLLYTGLHSPPVLDNRDFINENGILTLDPWAAAGPITRYPSEDNWIFRLSVDDAKAGEFITSYAIQEGYTKPYFVLEDTGWGRSNQITMTNALSKHEKQPLGISWFNWSLGINKAKLILRKAYDAGADVIFFVGNAPEGKVFAQAMSLLDENQRLPIRSHWGITGGDFQTVIGTKARKELDLLFLQTRFSFVSSNATPLSTQVLKRAYTLFPGEVEKPEDIEAPTGFIHAYDLTKLVIQAMRNVDEDLSTPLKRKALRLALENIEVPVEGLIKTYQSPFSIYSDMNTDAHEALDIEDFRMAYFNEDNIIILVD